MSRPNRLALLLGFLAILPMALPGLPLMHRTQTVIDGPEPGADVPLSGLSYHGSQFEAKVTSLHFELRGEAEADPVVSEWTFLGSNSDGQMHRVEIFVRRPRRVGKQLQMESKKCALSGGSHDQPCAVSMKVKAETWKAVRSARIATDWVS